MTSTGKQSELIRHRAIIQATLDYLVMRKGGSLVFDDYDFLVEYYQQQKIQAEKYFKLRRLDRLRQQLARLTKSMEFDIDMEFYGYIKETTGYELDIFAGLRERVEAVLERKEIRDDKEHSDVMQMLRYYEQTAGGKEIRDRLGLLLSAWAMRMLAKPDMRKSGYMEVISRVEKDGLIIDEGYFSIGPKPKHFVNNEVVSPDGRRRLRVVQWGNGTNSSTYVSVELKGGSGAIYGLDGIFPDVKAYWKDNQAIVIETEKDHKANTRCSRVRSFDDVIRIEYVIVPSAV